MRGNNSLFLAFTIGVLCLSSCAKVNPSTKESNPLVATKWYASYSDYLMVLEFISSTEVTGYFTKANGVYSSGQTSGTYIESGSKINFSGLSYRWGYAYYRLDAGNINGFLLSITGQKTFDIEKGDWSTWPDTFSKQ